MKTIVWISLLLMANALLSQVSGQKIKPVTSSEAVEIMNTERNSFSIFL